MYGVLSSRRPRAIAMFPGSNFHSSAGSFRIPDLGLKYAPSNAHSSLMPTADRSILRPNYWVYCGMDPSLPLQIWYSIRYLWLQNASLPWPSVTSNPHAAVLWYSVHRILHTRWSLPINVCARLDGYPAVRRVYSALFGAVRVCGLPEFCYLSLGILPGESASQAKKQNKKKRITMNRCTKLSTISITDPI